MRTTAIATTALALGLSAACLGQEAAKSLTVGDKAPKIDITHWLKGEQVKAFEPDKVYVVEFWATWCGPCKIGMPHITEVQKEYRDYDVTVIGVSNEPLQTVVDFLFQTDPTTEQIYNDITGYTLTTDPDESVWNDFFRAAGQSGIPCAFIVGKDGHVEWIGHPMTIDEPLHAVVHDEWDRDAAAAAFQKKQAASGKVDGLLRKFGAAQQAEDWAAAISAADEIIALGPPYDSFEAQKFIVLLTGKKDAAAAYTLGKKVAEESWDNPMLLNTIAWTIADDPNVPRRDLAFAMKCAARACELTENEDSAILDTLARVYFEQGALDDAIRYQKLAAEKAPSGAAGQSIRDTLAKYQKAAGGGR